MRSHRPRRQPPRPFAPAFGALALIGLVPVPGGNPGHLFNPDDAMMPPAGLVVPADIKNCRLAVITPTRVIGQTANACE